MPNVVQTIIFKILGDAKSADSALSKINKRLISFGAAVTAASAASLVAFAKLGEGGAKVEALEVKFASMAAAFGKSAEEMLAVWDKAAAGTIDRVTLMQKANQAALLGLPIDKLADMLEIARNAAMATGESVDYMFNSLVVGIARKSKPILDNLGIIISAEEAYAAYSKKVGKAADNLTAHEQQLAFLDATFAAAARQAEVLGDVVETTSTIIARARAKVKDARTELQKAFIPVAKIVAEIVIRLADAFKAIPTPIKEALAKVAAVAAVIGLLVGPIMVVLGALPLIQAAIGAIGAALGPILPIVAAIVAVLAVLAAGIALVSKAWREDWAGIKTAVLNVIDAIRPYITKIVRNVQFWLYSIKIQVMALVDTIRKLVEPLLERLKILLADGGGIKQFLLYLNDAISVAMSIVTKLISAIRMLLSGQADRAWMPLKDAALNVMTLIVLGWRKFGKQALTYGWNLVVNLANGIIRAARTILAQAATFVGNVLSRFFRSASPPKEGPLTGIVQWGKGLMDTYLRSFALADFGILRDTLSPIKDALQSEVDLGDLDQGEMLGIYRSVRTDAAALIAEFRRTGQINEDVLGGIAERLGEGGQEYAKYIRLTLEHQRALKNLTGVQAEVAAADARGFIPAELKARLAAAEDEVSATEEAVNWQQEYLAALQDGVDLQREMIQAIQDLSDAIKGIAGDEAAVEAAVLEPLVAPAAAALPETEAVEFHGFGGFSKEFQGVKAEIEAFFAGLPAKIEGWIGIAVAKVQEWLGIAKTAVVAKVQEIIKHLESVPIVATLITFFSETLPNALAVTTQWFDEKILPLLETLGVFMTTTLPEAFEVVREWFEEKLTAATDALLKVWTAFHDFARDYLKPLLEAVANVVDAVLNKALEALHGLFDKQILPVLRDAWTVLKDNLVPVFGAMALVIQEKVVPFLQDAWDGFNNIIAIVRDTLQPVLDTLAGFLSGTLSEAFEGLKTILGKITTKLNDLAEKIRNLELPAWLTPGSPTPFELGLRGIADALNLVNGGLNPLAMMQANLAGNPAGGIAGTLGHIGSTGAGAPIIVIQGGLEFPGVRDGRDRDGFLRELVDKAADEASLRGAVPGGLMANT